MSSNVLKPRVTSLAPQFLVDDLDRAIAYYRDVLGFTFGETWGGFYAIGLIDGLELHLKEGIKTRRSESIGGTTSTSTPPPAWMELKLSMNNASPTAPKSPSPWRRRIGGPKIFTSKIPTEISYASAGSRRSDKAHP